MDKQGVVDTMSRIKWRRTTSRHATMSSMSRATPRFSRLSRAARRLTLAALGALLMHPASTLASGPHDASLDAVVIVNPASGGVHRVWLKLNPAPPAPPTCATSEWHYTFNLANGSGRQVYAFLYAAQRHGELLTFEGKADCTLEPDIERLKSVEFAD